MGPTTKNVDIFGTFLGGSDREKAQSAGFPSLWSRIKGEMETAHNTDEEARIENGILARLNLDDGQNVISAGELLKILQAKPTQIIKTLADLAAAELIEEAGDGFKLTKLGRSLAQGAELK